METALFGVALAVGGLLTVQTSANLQLTRVVGTPYGASTLQLMLAVGILALLAAATGTLGAVDQLPGVEPWHLLGGLASPLYITSGILLFPRLGALASVGLFVTGQLFASLALDLVGLLGVPQRPLTVSTVVGGVAVLAGIAAVLGASVRVAATGGPPGEEVRGPALPGWILLGLVAGGVLPVQGAINALLRAELQNPLVVGLISFSVATATIAVVLALLVGLCRTPRPRLSELPGMPWWGWLGAGCAAAYVTATFLLIPQIGAATTVALTVTGQQLISAVVDRRGWFRLPQRRLTPSRVSGLVLLVAGCGLIQLA